MTAPLSVISSMATKGLLVSVELLAAQQANLDFSTLAVGGVDAVKRIKAGAAFDIAVLSADAVDELAASGHLRAGSAVAIARSGIAVAVASGAGRIDIGSESALRDAVRAAPSIGCSTGPSGVYLATLFERWGISDEVCDRLVIAPPGVPVGSLVADGKVALGFQQMSELVHVPGIVVLGALPPAVQSITTFAGAIVASSQRPDEARQLLAYLASPATATAKQAQGMDPA